MIDYFLVNGSGRNVNRIARIVRRFQSGYLYHYAFVMILAVLVFLAWMIL